MYFNICYESCAIHIVYIFIFRYFRLPLENMEVFLLKTKVYKIILNSQWVRFTILKISIISMLLQTFSVVIIDLLANITTTCISNEQRNLSESLVFFPLLLWIHILIKILVGASWSVLIILWDTLICILETILWNGCNA